MQAYLICPPTRPCFLLTLLRQAQVWVWWCASVVVCGLVQVRTWFGPEVQSNQSLDLNIPKRVQSSFELTRTLGPVGSVQFEPGSEVR